MHHCIIYVYFVALSMIVLGVMVKCAYIVSSSRL